MAEEIKIDLGQAKGFLKKMGNFFAQKKVQNIIILILFLVILISSSAIRIQNLPLLKDQTTGEYIPLALDPFYFLRVAETRITNNGDLPEFDSMRRPFDIGWSKEILPQTVIGLYKISNIFGEYSLQFIDVISPIIFFMLSLVLFFLLVAKLTKSKITALLGTSFLGLMPPFLYRTMAGFADHEAIGMLAFFIFMLMLAISLKYLDKNLKNSKKIVFKKIILGILLAFSTALTIVSWGGIARYVFMILPLSTLIYWFIQRKNNKNKLKEILLGYMIWFFLFLIITSGIFSYSILEIIKNYALNSVGFLPIGIFFFMLIDYLVLTLNKKEILKIKNDILISVIVLTILSFLFLIFTKNLSLISEIAQKLLHPFGEGRVSLTVAENKQPYLRNWQGSIGKVFFWTFFAGLLVLGNEIKRKISSRKKHRASFMLFWILMVLGILFSRISPNSILNGTNIISNTFYFGAIFVFGAYCAWLYHKEKIQIRTEWIICFSWMFFMLISARGAIRLFFVITPFAAFASSIVPIKLFEYAKKNKDELTKLFLWIFFLGSIIAILISLNNFYSTSSMQAKYTGPSANNQWQEAMQWVRENTSENATFVHWWDYGYWIQYLGKRGTLADGGHFQGKFRNHLIGRYVLTTPKPETALSFMKTNNATYLLIDPTDIGKYGAYSKIGSGENGEDRYGYIPIFNLDPKQTQETENFKTLVYAGGTVLDEDFTYEKGGKEIFLPKDKTILAAILLNISNSEDSLSFGQPQGYLIYNNQKYLVPIKNIYFKEEMLEFKKGLDATLRIVPSARQNEKGLSVNSFGSLIYLSPKISQTLFSQLYLMNGVSGNYEEFELVHSEGNSILDFLEFQNLLDDDFVNYQGIQGKIKIYQIKEFPKEILVREEFLRRDGDWAEFDNLTFTQ